MGIWRRILTGSSRANITLNRPSCSGTAAAEHDTEFLPVPEELCGPDLVQPIVGRGAAYADIDGDGDLDVLITATGQSPRLLRNDQDEGHHWLRFRLIGKDCNRDAIGAWVEVELADRVLRSQVMPTRSYLSQCELPVSFGLGKDPNVRRVTVYWPDSYKQELAPVVLDQLHVVEQANEGTSLTAATEAQQQVAQDE